MKVKAREAIAMAMRAASSEVATCVPGLGATEIFCDYCTACQYFSPCSTAKKRTVVYLRAFVGDFDKTGTFSNVVILKRNTPQLAARGCAAAVSPSAAPGESYQIL
jgi:hypothetical protein